jgi:uncharacterized protein (TIGR02118 family)
MYAKHARNTIPKIPNLLRFGAAKLVATPDGSEPPYYRIFEVYFEDMPQLQSVMSTSEGQAPPADFPDFTTGGATTFISAVDAWVIENTSAISQEGVPRCSGASSLRERL